MADTSKVSPLAPAAFPELPEIKGARFATAAAGVKYAGRDDVMLAVLDPGTVLAGVFTKSTTRAAPVLDCQEKLKGMQHTGAAAILVNSGNANAFTGRHGTESVSVVTEAVAKATGIDPARVLTSSTGVIGEPLPHDRIVATLDSLNATLKTSALSDAAGAIMTTDTYPKGAAQTVSIDGKPVQIAGIAKGSGMIAPDMATMLVYLFTDAVAGPAYLKDVTARLCDQTFNCITVDSDTSTSDSLIVAATGSSGVGVDESTTFEAALRDVMLDLAHQVVKDGEGATKFVEITVSGAKTPSDARTHAMAIANSPLVKTAIAGEDPNWGRIVMAIGKSGAEADRDQIRIQFGDVLVADRGWVHPGYVEADAAEHMKGDHVHISVDLGLGPSAVTVWTCDLTHGYISINADYRS